MKRYINSVINLKDGYGFWKKYYASKKQPKSGSFKVGLRSGLTAEVPHALLSAFDEVFLREQYKTSVKNFSAAPTVLDMGANVGYFSLYILGKYPKAKVIAFEPLPTNLGLLEKHKSLNNLGGLTIDRRAVFATEKSITINYNKEVDYSVMASFLDRNTSSSMEIPAVSIPDIFNEYQLETVDLLKVDCEGSEYNILFNCPDEYFAKIQNLAIETHDWVPASEGDVYKLKSFMESKGFKASHQERSGMLWCNK